MSCFFAQSCISWLLKHDLWSLSSWWRYLYMVLGFFNFLMVVAWLVWWWGKSWVRLDSVHTHQGIFRTVTQREGASITHSPILHQLNTLVNGPRLLWPLPWALFRTHKTCWRRVNHVTKFQGQSDIFGNVSCHPGAATATLHLHPICCVDTPQRYCRFGSRPLQ